jgi:hypothetical protein
MDQSLNIIECKEFRKLLLLLRQDLKDSDIPHRTKIRESVIYQILPSPTPVLQGQLRSVLCLGQLHTSEPPDLVQLH